MPRAIWNGRVLAEGEKYEVVEGNVYFPPESLRSEFFRESNHTTTCSWKGEARYLTASVDGEEAVNVAWYYPDPKGAAENIRDYVAFYPRVTVER
ncbi:MAG: DUF427 domain-containing protein [Dehalococcoidia bacterium]